MFSVDTFTPYSASDYNGFRPNPGAATAFEWGTSPPGAIDFSKIPPVKKFATLKAFTEATGQDRHSVLVDYDLFVKAQSPDRTHLRGVYKAADFDFRRRPGSAAADAGVAIPNITDGFTGKAPDLGAYELGAPAPRYGPRYGPRP